MGEPARRTIRLDDLIFKATDALLIGPDYTAIMQICDVLNNRKERVPLAVGVLKERLKHREKDVVLRTLELLDAVTKNVPESIQYVGSKDFLAILKKTATNKKTEFLVKETILAYIQSCALAFKHKSGAHFAEVYEALRKEGVSFPAPEKEATQLLKQGTSPGQSPNVGHRQQQQQQQASSLAQWRDKPDAPSRSSPMSRKKGTHRGGGRDAGKEEKLLLAFSSGGVGALEQELSLLQNSIELADEILRNARSRIDLQGNDVLDQVLSTCQSVQPQVQSLLAVPSPPMTEDMVAALLYANDRLLAVQSLHQSVLNGERVAHQVRAHAGASDEDESSSSSEDEEDSQNEDFAGSSGHPVPRQDSEAIPQLLRGPPKARTATNLHPSHQLPQSSEDLLDEFAALALRHRSAPPVASPTVTLPPQPHPLSFPYTPSPAPSGTLLFPPSTAASATILPAGASPDVNTNPFLLASPSPSYFPAGTLPSYSPYAPATTPLIPGSASVPTVPTPGGPLPAGMVYPSYYPQTSYPQFHPTNPTLPSGWGAPHQPPQQPTSSSIQDDFDLLFGKSQ